VTLIDWKTGKRTSEDVSLQLSCYAMYAVEKWGVDAEKVKLIEYNLLANQGVEFSVSVAEIENTKTYIAGSIADMQSTLVDVDNNVPKEEEAFQKVEDDRIRSGCNFKKVCE
jgi:CRISPR/Cas system-associated exonuclease Cas4 (RecB family)